jgi:hypothetical protein
VFFHLSGVVKMGEDRRGKGFLPYAPDAINEVQLSILNAARAIKADAWTVGSHFTIASLQDSIPADVAPDQAGFDPGDKPNKSNPFVQGDANAQYNYFNWGGCERNLKTYLNDYTSIGKAPEKGRVSMHLSGHTHRAGVYSLSRKNGRNDDKDAAIRLQCKVPGFPGKLGQIDALSAGTRYSIASAGGGIGRQGVAGLGKDGKWSNNGTDDNAFLGGWLMQAPSGNLNDTASGKIELVVANKDTARNDIPRLAVMLDYREIISVDEGNLQNRPIAFDVYGDVGKSSLGVPVRYSEEMRTLDCIEPEKIKVWVFEAGKETQEDRRGGRNKNIVPATPVAVKKGAWKSFSARIRRGNGAIDWLQIDKMKEIINALVPAADKKRKVALCAFLEIQLKQPANGPNIPWEQINCDESWVFPIEIEQHPNGGFMLYRDTGEKGEVPKWGFLEEYFGEKYPKSRDVIYGESAQTPTKKG